MRCSDFLSCCLGRWQMRGTVVPRNQILWAKCQFTSFFRLLTFGETTFGQEALMRLH